VITDGSALTGIDRKRKDIKGSYRLWTQPIDATAWLNRSAGAMVRAESRVAPGLFGFETDLAFPACAHALGVDAARGATIPAHVRGEQLASFTSITGWITAARVRHGAARGVQGSGRRLSGGLCRINEPPQKPYSGKLSLRLEPVFHASVAVKAELANKSIDQWIVEVLTRETHA
jgi:hypothetical protein